MNTVGTPLLWGGFAVVVVIMLSIDLLLQGRRGAHAMSMKQAAGWSILWVTLSLLFNAAFWWYLAETQGREVADPQALAFLTGYLIEKSLAVDNVFVWLMLFSYFSVPPALQRRVLVYGVLGAIVLRTIMIFAITAYHSVRMAAVCVRCLPAVYRRKNGAGEGRRIRHWRKTDGALAARASAHD